MMKRVLRSLLLLILCLPFTSYGQLPDGSTAPDFTLTDIDGNTHHLYDLLDQGKMVVVEFSATWCGPCWYYMLGGALEEFWEEHGPNGTDEAQVFYIESDFSTGMADLLGQTSQSQGNWIAQIPFPIIDLQPGQTTAGDYGILYYPTLYAICSDHKVYELGQVPASEWAEFIQSCALDAEVSDIEEAECFGTGSATVDATGGVAPINYSWSNGDNGATLDDVGAGTYAVTVIEGNGRTIILNNIVVPGADEPIGLSYEDVEDALCFGAASGNISIALEEGTPPYTYNWSNGAHTQNLSNVPAGTYDLEAYDSHGCPFESSFEILEPEPISVESELTPDYCDQSNGTVELTIEGGVGGYEISSSDGTVYGNHVIDLSAGSVQVDVEDNNGCIWTDDFTISGEAAHDLYFTPDPHITCIQPSTTVTGYVNNGSGEFTYAWYTTNGHINGPANQPAISADAGGDYNLLVTDILTGCDVESQVHVSSQIDPPPTFAGDDSPISCENLQLSLSGTGDASLTINWTTSNGHILSGGNTYNPTVDAPGEYTINVLNPANQCTNSDVVTVINELHPAEANYQFQTSSLTMIGTDQSLGSNVSGWAWTFGDGATSNDPNIVHTFSAAGTYDVCLSVQNGCGVNQYCHAVEVTFTGSLISVDAAITNELCFAGLTGAILLTVNGGSGNYTYQWTGPDGTVYTTPSIDSLTAGAYQLVISDDAGNIFINEYSILQPDQLIIANSTIADNVCYGDAIGSVSVDIAGGVGPFLYSFNGGAFQTSNSITNLLSGNYDCVITDANGCPLTAGPFLVAQPADLSYEGLITNVKCFGESNGAISLQLGGGVAPYTHLWSTGESTSLQISQLAAGSYSCQVTDLNGCVDNLVIVVTQPDELVANNVQVTNASGTGNTDGKISLEPVGGTPPYSIDWNNGAAGDTITGLAPGEYTYVITDANGCTFSPSAPLIVGGAVGITPVPWASNVSLAPNPSNGQTFITWHDLNSTTGNISIVTLEGKKIASHAIGASGGNWDLSPVNLQGGVYIVLIQVKDQSVPYKLIVFN